MITGCPDMGTGALKTVTTKLHDAVEALLDAGNLGSDYLDPLQSLEASFVHGLAVVRHLVNAARPVNRLPPEILAKIFFLLTESAALERVVAAHPSNWQLDPIRIRRLHAVPTVCHYWHDVALGTRSLWPIIWFAPKHRRGELIHKEESVHMHNPYPFAAEYSGPLSVYFSDVNPRNVKEPLEKYAVRIRELYVIMGRVANPEDVSALLDTLETIPGDMLEHFAMKLPIETVSPRKLSFFARGAAKLRSLVMQMADSYVPTNTFPALTHLVVSSKCWTLDTFLGLLARCSRLEHAHFIWLPTLPMQRNYLGPERNLPAPEKRIDLRHIRRFTFSFTAIERILVSAVDIFLCHIALPPSCHVYLAPHAQAGSLNAPIGAQLMSSVLRHWPVPATVATSESSFPRVRLDFDIDAELQLAHPHGTGSLTLRSRQVRAAAIVQEMVRAATTAIPPFTRGTEELWIRAQLRRGSADVDGATALLLGLPALERLVVAGNPAAILQALRLVPRADRAPGDTVLCPELDTLSVFLYSRRECEAAREVLAARARAGYPVRCVVIPGPLPGARDPVTEEDVQTLWALVEEVVVVDMTGWERAEVDWWTGRLREACASNAALVRNLRCDWPTCEYQYLEYK